MALRFQLINDIVGSLVIDRDDPIDINSLTQTVKRSELYSGIVYEIIFDIEFIKGGKAFLKAAYETAGGIDAIVVVNIYELDTNARRWRLYTTGQVDYNRYELDEISVIVNVEQTGVERRVLNMMELDVDLETLQSENGSALPPQLTQHILHHSKAISKELNSTPDGQGEFQQLDLGGFFVPNIPVPVIGEPFPIQSHLGLIWYGQIDNSNIINDELTNKFDTPYGFVTFSNPSGADQISGAGDLSKYTAFLSDPSRLDVRNPMYEASESGNLDIDIGLRLKSTVSANNTGGDVDMQSPFDNGCLGHVEVFAFCEKRDKDDNIIFIDEIGSWNLAGYGGSSRIGVFETKSYTRLAEPITVGDKIYVYVIYRVYGTYEHPSSFPTGPDGVVHHDFTLEADETRTFINFKNLTVATEKEVKGILIYEAVQRCLQYYTNQVDCFKSNLLGRTDIGYAEDGKASLITIENGYWLRGLDELHLFTDPPSVLPIYRLFTNLKYLIDFLNSVFCIGFGFEIIDGKQKFVLEPIAYFFRKDTKILSLGKVFNPKKKINSKGFYNMVEYGYTTKLNTKKVNGIDEFNTLRREIIPILNTKNKLEIASDMITAGHLIEEQKRLSVKTEDNEFDNRLFAVVVLRDGLGYKTKKDEGYSLIENVISPETGYNYDLAPAECLKNWLPVIASSLIRSFRKELRFSYGEVNYLLKRTKTGETVAIAENGNFDATFVQPIWDNEFYIIPTVKFTREQMQLIKASPYGYIEFQDRNGEFFEGFISSNGIEHEEPKSKAELNLLRVFRPTV